MAKYSLVMTPTPYVECIDYCNSLLYGISSTLLRRLQSIQNAAARLVTGAMKFGHITPVLRELHWLLIRQRITYKLSLIVYKCLHNAAPVYLSSDCVPVSSLAGRRHGRRQLRSSVSGTLDSQRTRSWSSRVQSVRPCDVECSADRTAYCYCVPRHFRQKTENLFVQEQLLRAH